MTNPPVAGFNTEDLLVEARRHIKSLLPAIGAVELTGDESARLLAAMAPRPGVAGLDDLNAEEVIGLLGVIRDISKAHRIVGDIAASHRAVNVIHPEKKR